MQVTRPLSDHFEPLPFRALSLATCAPTLPPLPTFCPRRRSYSFLFSSLPSFQPTQRDPLTPISTEPTFLSSARSASGGQPKSHWLSLSLSLSDRPLQILVRCPSNSHTLIRSLSWSLCNQSELNRSILSDFDFGGSLDRHQLTPCRKRPLRGPFRSTQPLRFYYPFLLTF